MESLSCGFEGKGLLFGDDTDLVVDRSRNLLKKWDGEDNIGFIEPVLGDSINNSFVGGVSDGDDTKDHSSSPANDRKYAALLSSPSPKRAKIGDSVPTCQVYGCNKDLSSSKDYHKRHKVCDVHSKTAVVIVDGISQRFCQQCSRFHILAEFDEGKRSCRKRLAGHNERRRKPQFNTYLGSTYLVASKPLFFSTEIPDAFLGLQYNETRQSLPKSVVRFHGLGKQYPSKNCLNTPSLPDAVSIYASSDSACALSLLSATEQNSLSNSAAANQNSLKRFTTQNYSTNLGDSLYDYNGRATATNTVNLLELSLHLHRVEHQKFYCQIKMENDNFCDSTIL